MKNKLAKLEYLPNNFKVLEEGDHVICAVSGKKIFLNNSSNWIFATSYLSDCRVLYITSFENFVTTNSDNKYEIIVQFIKNNKIT